VAIAYFPSKWRALKHAVRAAKAKRCARVAILEIDGAERLARDYASTVPGEHSPEVP
jgi:predicted component of type VI protein secretion system